MNIIAFQLAVLSLFGYTDFNAEPLRQELDFPAGRIGGHAPTGVSWTAPEDTTVDLVLDAWKLRNNANVYITVWVNGEKRLDKALIPEQGPTWNSADPYPLSHMLKAEGVSANALEKIQLKKGDTLIVEIGGNDYAGLDLAIKSTQHTWDLAKDFRTKDTAGSPWLYGPVEVSDEGKPKLTVLDTLIPAFNPDAKGQFGAGQPAWINKELPGHLSMIKSVGSTPTTQEFSHVSDKTVYTEALIDERWVGRHWSADGTLKIGYEGFLQNAFVLAIDGQRLESGWRLTDSQETEDTTDGTRHTVIGLSNKYKDIDIAIHTDLDGTPIITRWLEITNTGDKAVALTELSPWAGRLVTHKNFWASGGAPKRFEHPFTLGYFTESDHNWEGRFKWFPIEEDGVTEIGCHKGQCYDDPFFIIKHEGAGQHLIGSLEWSANWNMQVEYNGNGAHTLLFKIGPWASEALRVIAPGETVKTPAVHFGLLAEDLDTTVQAMHEHVRRSVFPKRDPELSNLVQYALPGDQGYLSQNFGDSSGYTVESVRKNIDMAAAIGAELFIMDAGWWDIQGDWEPSAKRFPNGLKPLSDYARENGMLFGLYGEIEKASSASKIGREHPEWIKWYEPFPVLDLANPKAAAHMEKELERIIEDFGLDLFRLDFNTPVGEEVMEGDSFQRQGIEENNFWRYYDSFGEIFERIHTKYPNLILQQAACGGGRNDLATARRFHENYLTDGSRLPFETQNYAGQSLALPPENFVIAHGADGGGPTGHAENFETNLRVAFTLATPWIFAGNVAPDLEHLSPYRLERYQHYVKLYKDFIRPIQPTSKVFHHAPISARGGIESQGFFAMEFSDPDRSQGWATFIRIGPHETDTYLFKPRGLDRGKTYQVTFDATDETVLVDGLSLVRDGLPVRLENLAASELILFKAVE